tara:strand:- start:23 stop:130 length:108 start_codon:yes stop_codon:yes gene_type:complete
MSIHHHFRSIIDTTYHLAAAVMQWHLQARDISRGG